MEVFHHLVKIADFRASFAHISAHIQPNGFLNIPLTAIGQHIEGQLSFVIMNAFSITFSISIVKTLMVVVMVEVMVMVKGMEGVFTMAFSITSTITISIVNEL